MLCPVNYNERSKDVIQKDKQDDSKASGARKEEKFEPKQLVRRQLNLAVDPLQQRYKVRGEKKQPSLDTEASEQVQQSTAVCRMQSTDLRAPPGKLESRSQTEKRSLTEYTEPSSEIKVISLRKADIDKETNITAANSAKKQDTRAELQAAVDKTRGLSEFTVIDFQKVGEALQEEEDVTGPDEIKELKVQSAGETVQAAETEKEGSAKSEEDSVGEEHIEEGVKRTGEGVVDKSKEVTGPEEQGSIEGLQDQNESEKEKDAAAEQIKGPHLQLGEKASEVLRPEEKDVAEMQSMKRSEGKLGAHFVGEGARMASKDTKDQRLKELPKVKLATDQIAEKASNGAASESDEAKLAILDELAASTSFLIEALSFKAEKTEGNSQALAVVGTKSEASFPFEQGGSVAGEGSEDGSLSELLDLLRGGTRVEGKTLDEEAAAHDDETKRLEEKQSIEDVGCDESREPSDVADPTVAAAESTVGNSSNALETKNARQIDVWSPGKWDWRQFERPAKAPAEKGEEAGRSKRQLFQESTQGAQGQALPEQGSLEDGPFEKQHDQDSNATGGLPESAQSFQADSFPRSDGASESLPSEEGQLYQRQEESNEANSEEQASVPVKFGEEHGKAASGETLNVTAVGV